MNDQSIHFREIYFRFQTKNSYTGMKMEENSKTQALLPSTHGKRKQLDLKSNAIENALSDPQTQEVLVMEVNYSFFLFPPCALCQLLSNISV